MSNVTRIQMFTDGACKGNPGIGGWGVIIEHESGTMELKDMKNSQQITKWN